MNETRKRHVVFVAIAFGVMQVMVGSFLLGATRSGNLTEGLATMLLVGGLLLLMGTVLVWAGRS